MRYPDDSGGALSTFLNAAPAGAVVQVAPGSYEGPLSITQPITLRGAGELTRIRGGCGRPISISVGAAGQVVLDSLRLERGESEDGGAVLVTDGDVRMSNIHIQWCTAKRRGGAIAVLGGRVAAQSLQVLETTAERGGALWVGHNGQLSLHDSQVGRCEAALGGALAVEGSALVEVAGLTVRRARARSSSGGQALHVRSIAAGAPQVRLDRVWLDGSTFGAPIVVEASEPSPSTKVYLRASDVPRSVRTVPGVVDGGANRWR